MVDFLLVLLVVVGMAFTSNPEKTEQSICFEKKVKCNILHRIETSWDCKRESKRMKTWSLYRQSGGEHNSEHDPPGARD